jgi:hypothetical protein
MHVPADRVAGGRRVQTGQQRGVGSTEASRGVLRGETAVQENPLAFTVTAAATRLDDGRDVRPEVHGAPSFRGEHQARARLAQRVDETARGRSLGVLVTADAPLPALVAGPDPARRPEREAVLVEDLELDGRLGREVDVVGAVLLDRRLADQAA